MLQALLRQIHEEATEETDSDDKQTVAKDNTQSICVVGPTTTELESLNELIKFDHVYYKSEADVASPSDVSSVNRAVSKSGKVQPTSVNSLLKTNIVQTTPDVTADLKEATISSADDNSDIDLPHTLEDIDFAALSESLEQQLIDLDAILKDSVAMETSQEEKASDICEPLLKKQKLCESDFVQETKVKIETDTAPALPDDLFSQSSDFLIVPSSPVLKSGSLSDSGYSSDAASPRSDVSVLYETDNHWEESFTELFPSLL